MYLWLLQALVKWYNERLGYGFLQRDEGDDVFVHYTALVDDEVLEEGEAVEFDIGEGPKRPMATNVVKV